MQKSALRGRIWRVARWIGLAIVLGLIAAIASAWSAFGAGAKGERRARMEKSPEWKSGHFENPQPLINDFWGSITGMFDASPDVSPSPSKAVPTVATNLSTPPASGLRVTWLGHSSTIVELDGHRVLTDPVWSLRSSPLTWIGPTRWYPAPAVLEDLKPIDVVVISHDHYDHLDMQTIKAMKDWKTVFVVPLGIGAHLAYWGIPADRIIELDWWERTKVGGLEIVMTPARHASGRTVFDKDATLWAGYALIGATHRVYYSGDTGLFPAMKQIGEKLGPFDLTMIEVGQYNRAWPDWHIGPEQAVTAHAWVKGKVLLPVHWGLFPLAAHGWTEPIERVLAAGLAAGQTLVAPRPGQSVEPGAAPPFEKWWPDVPWTAGAKDPIVSSQLD
jgi:L-ascorbate metabolism protein UlaG (beta-lactamase superfamily)